MQNDLRSTATAPATFYLKMAGDTTAVPTGAFEELLATAERQGNVTPEEIAAILDTEQLAVDAELSWSVGGSDDR